MKAFIHVILLSLCVSAFGQTTYYVSSDSSLSTIAQVNALSLQPGDSVLFQAGRTWREILLLGESGTSDDWIYFGRYGEGNNPKILGSEVIRDGWASTGTYNVWQRTGTGYANPQADGSNGGEIYFLKNDSASWGLYQTYTSNFSNLTTEFHWTYNGGTFYIYAPSDPNSRYDSVEVSQRLHCIAMTDNSPEEYHEFNGIDLMFAFNRGFYAGYPASNARGQIFRNMRIGYIGRKGDIRGYGLHVWHSDMLVENCYFSDCGRRAISLNLYQFMPIGSNRNISNIIIRNNVFRRGQHTTALDLAMTPSTQGDTIQDVYFYNNYIDDSEIEMNMGDESSNQVFIQVGGGTIQKIYITGNLMAMTTARQILFEGGRGYVWNNTFAGTNPNYLTSTFGNTSFRAGAQIDFRNNISWNTSSGSQGANYGNFMENSTSAYLGKDYNLYWQNECSSTSGRQRYIIGVYNSSHSPNGFYCTTDWASYLSRSEGWDQNAPVPSNPYFKDFAEKDYMLSDSSAAVNSGGVLSKMIWDFSIGDSVDIMAADINGNQRNFITSSIGAYEYVSDDQTLAYISLFTLTEQTTMAVIDTAAKTVAIEVKDYTDVTTLTPTILVNYGATISPVSGITRDFTTPQTYTVTASDGVTTEDYTVTVTVDDNRPPEARNVTIINDPYIDSVIYVSYTYYDYENDAEGTSTFQWYINNVLTDSVRQHFTLSQPDSGYMVYATVTPVAATGESPGTIVNSDTIGPVVPISTRITSAEIGNYVNNVIVVTFDNPLDDGYTPAESDFTVTEGGSLKAVSSAFISGGNLLIQLSERGYYGETYLLSYTWGSAIMRGISGDRVMAFSDSLVNNNVGPHIAENLFLFSEEIDNAAWGKLYNTQVTTNQYEDLEGDLTLEFLEDGGPANYLIALEQNVPSKPNTTYTFSFEAQSSNPRTGPDGWMWGYYDGGFLYTAFGDSVRGYTSRVSFQFTTSSSERTSLQFRPIYRYSPDWSLHMGRLHLYEGEIGSRLYVRTEEEVITNYIPVPEEIDSTESDILAFTLVSQTGSATINTVNHTVSIDVAYGTNVTSLTPSIMVSRGATIDPTSGTARNFVSPQTYTVTALDEITEQEWTVTVTVASAPPTGRRFVRTANGYFSKSVSGKPLYYLEPED